MDPKSLVTLELPKILERLASYAAFSASADLARRLTPTTELTEARRWQQETSEARKLLAVKTDTTIGGARDVRPLAQNAARGAVLLPGELLEVKATLIAARILRRTLTRLEAQFPRLAAIAFGLEEAPGIVEAVSHTIDERNGEVMDSASERLAAIRREVRQAHDRLMQKLQRLITDPNKASLLQEPIITQRDGRYVIPLKANFRGRIRGIVHDQSASGATLFIEPLATVELNNQWRELQLKEQEEIRRILTELSALVGEQAEVIVRVVETLAELDLAFAKAKYAEAVRGSEPVLAEIPNPKHQIQNSKTHIQKPKSEIENSHLPRTQVPGKFRAHPGTTIRLRAARHPLLDAETVVPIDVELDDETFVLVITGPNTGGKTVSLKTVGLLALMAQCGLHIPAQSGSELSVFQNVFADIGDEQSIEQSLSTFSSHITNTIRILAHADDRSLVILDELGAGTDPGEGAALARAILSYLLDKGATTLVATHYPELKVYANNTPGVKNASVEFDLESLRPTFHLTIGLPGRSNAFAISSRLGLDETIISEARSMVSTADVEAEKLLDEIHRQRAIVREERARAEEARTEVEMLELRLNARLEQIEAERRKVLEAAQKEAREDLEALRAELAELKRKLAGAALPLEALKEVEEAVEALEEEAEKPIAGIIPERGLTVSGRPRPLRLGDTVLVRTLNATGVITGLSAENAEVQIGRLRLRAKPDELSLVVGEVAEDTSSVKRKTSHLPRTHYSPRSEAEREVPGNVTHHASRVTHYPSPVTSPGMELDIRGQLVEDGLAQLERYLDAAYLAGLPWVRIIHGKGTGKLRAAIRQALKGNPIVAGFEGGQDGEGGEGVTVAKLTLAD